jgi:hypothetical protein
MEWAKGKLEGLGHEVFVPEMPDTNTPKIAPWVGKLAETVGEVREDDVFIGHSIGTLTVLRYIESLPERTFIKKIILVAPWHVLTLDESENPETAEPWIEEPMDWGKVKSRIGKTIAVFSKDDPWVPIKENLEFFKEKLDPTIIVKDGMGHFNDSEIPFLLDLV